MGGVISISSMRGSTFFGRYATSTDSSSGDFPRHPPSASPSTARSAPPARSSRPPLAAGDRRRPRAPVLLRLVQVSAARLHGDLPAVQVALRSSAGPTANTSPESNTSLSIVPSCSSPGPISYTLPDIPGGRVQLSVAARLERRDLRRRQRSAAPCTWWAIRCGTRCPCSPPPAARGPRCRTRWRTPRPANCSTRAADCRRARCGTPRCPRSLPRAPSRAAAERPDARRLAPERPAHSP